MIDIIDNLEYYNPTHFLFDLITKEKVDVLAKLLMYLDSIQNPNVMTEYRNIFAEQMDEIKMKISLRVVNTLDLYDRKQLFKTIAKSENVQVPIIDNDFFRIMKKINKKYGIKNIKL